MSEQANVVSVLIAKVEELATENGRSEAMIEQLEWLLEDAEEKLAKSVADEDSGSEEY